MKIFYHLPACRVECVSEYIIYFFQKKKKKKQNKKTKKAKETKEEKRISVKILTGYDDIVCKFALCTFNISREFLLAIHVNLMYIM